MLDWVLRLAYQLKLSDLFLFYIIISNSVFFLNAILSSFFIMSVKDLEGRFVQSRKVIMKQYWKTKIIFDFLSFCSFACIVDSSFLIFEVFRLVHFPETIHIIKKLIEFIIKRLVRRASYALTLYRVTTRLVTFCIYFVVSLQILTCFWIFLSEFDEGPVVSWINENKLNHFEVYLNSLHLVLTYPPLLFC